MANRRRIRSLEHVENLFSSDGVDGPRFLRKISREKGDKLVADGRAVRHVDPDSNECFGYQLMAAGAAVGLRKATAGVAEIDSKPSSCVLSETEAAAAIGFDGKSRTEHLPEWGRMQRIARGLKEMDHIEAAKVKLDSFAPQFAA